MWKFGLAVLFALSAMPVHAEWQVASSDHFVVYADDSAKDVQRFSEQLEQFHSAMAYLTNREVVPASPSNRVTIYVLGSQDEVKRLAEETGNSGLAGFYQPRAGASRAFVSAIRLTSGELDFSQIVLLHEYAHHFLWSGTSVSMPKWLSEGAAEFFATARFPKDGTVHIGLPAMHRAGELAYARDVSARELIDPDLYKQRHGNHLDAFYGRSWLLYHMLIFDPDRKGQFDAYWNGLVQGKDPIVLAQAVFGDFDVLNRDMDRYLTTRKKNFFDLTPDMIHIGPVTVTAISVGHTAMMPLIIRSQRGVAGEDAAQLASEARTIAARYPGDAQVLTALAKAEYDAGNDAATIAASDRALAIDPSIADAYVQKGLALFRSAEDAKDMDQAIADALKPFLALSRIEPDHPIPLIYYYRSFQLRGVRPPLEAKQGFARAAQLAPFDSGLWFDASLLFASEGLISRARRGLLTLANNPHGGSLTESARRIVEAMDAIPEGEPYYPASELFSASAAD